MSDPRKNMETPWRDEELMERLAKEKSSQNSIAEEIGTTRRTVGIWLRKFGFEGFLKEKPWKDEETLREAYLELGTQKKVAEKFGCNKLTIQQWMETHDITVRKKHPSHPFYHKEKLQNLYEKHGSVERVREELECSPNHLRQWMEYHGIHRNWTHKYRGETVSPSCSQCGEITTVYKSIREQFDKWFCSRNCMGKWQSENQVGEDHPSWKGGHPGYGEGWYYARKGIRERDGDVCQNCGLSDGDRVPDVHHIEPVRSFEDPSNAHSLDNLIQLCRPCHNRMEKYSPEKQRKILNLD